MQRYPEWKVGPGGPNPNSPHTTPCLLTPASTWATPCPPSPFSAPAKREILEAPTLKIFSFKEHHSKPDTGNRALVHAAKKELPVSGDCHSALYSDVDISSDPAQLDLWRCPVAKLLCQSVNSVRLPSPRGMWCPQQQPGEGSLTEGVADAAINVLDPVGLRQGLHCVLGKMVLRDGIRG